MTTALPTSHDGCFYPTLYVVKCNERQIADDIHNNVSCKGHDKLTITEKHVALGLTKLL